jgi:GNAT superfamily N-acetyltransferase
MQLRALTGEDATVFHAFRLAALSESPAAFGSTYAEEAGMSLTAVAEGLAPDPTGVPRAVLGAFAPGGALVGIVGVYRERGVKRQHGATLWGMYVTPAHRGLGLGRRLLDAALETARGWPGVARVSLTVVTASAPARTLYLRAGFRSVGVDADALRAHGVSYALEWMVLNFARPGSPG